MDKTDEIFLSVSKILEDISNLNFSNPCCNERYLHHYFSQKIQEAFPVLYEDYKKSLLHPEWATANKIRTKGGKYRKNANEYCCDKFGTSGFIDFVIGDYEEPELGIEFKVRNSWNSESLIFDYMKLMDNRNSIKSSISFAIIFRENNLSNRLNISKMNSVLSALEDRLKNGLLADRKFLFRIVEIAAKSQEKRSWYCNNLNKKFTLRST